MKADEIFNSFSEVKNYMVKDIIKYNNKKFLLSTVLIDNCVFETMVFPIINGQVSGSEVYTFRTVESGKSLNKHKDIYEQTHKKTKTATTAFISLALAGALLERLNLSFTWKAYRYVCLFLFIPGSPIMSTILYDNPSNE